MKRIKFIRTIYKYKAYIKQNLNSYHKPASHPMTV